MAEEQADYIGWHVLAVPGKLRDGSAAASKGDTEVWGGKLVICKSGLHACARPLDALQYVSGSYFRRVSLASCEVKNDKAVGRRRLILGEAEAAGILHESACDWAETALRKAKVEDSRSWRAISTKREWLNGFATAEELDAARVAAWAAARDAAWDAAGAAVEYTAQDATWAEMNGDLEERLLNAMGLGK